MKWLFISGILVTALLFSFFPKTIFAANLHKYAVCDRCGLCVDVLDDTRTSSPNIQVRMRAYTETWPACMKCLYPEIVTNDPNKIHGDYQSLTLIPDPKDPDHNIPYPSKPGHFYSGLGCFSTNLSDFTQAGAAGALTGPLLNVLLSLGGGIAFVYLLYGSFLVVTSHGSSRQLNQGRQTIYGAVIGIIFAMSGVFLINLIGNGVLRIPGF